MPDQKRSNAAQIAVYMEAGSKRTFASARDWPGWSRSGKDEGLALQALLEYAPRYAAAVRSARVGFSPPADVTAFEVLERLKGDMTTDFGTPGRVPALDAHPVDDEELRRLQAILNACWRAFDRTAESARGKALRTGPRGGGRVLEKIISHVREAQSAYVSRLGWKAGTSDERWQDAPAALLAAAHGKLPARGPRGALYWPPRYFVRRAAWHLLDHAWEIEDRLG